MMPKQENRYSLKLSDADTINTMGEPVYFVKEWDDGLKVKWTLGILCATTFTRAEVDEFRKKYPHIGGRVVINRG